MNNVVLVLSILGGMMAFLDVYKKLTTEAASVTPPATTSPIVVRSDQPLSEAVANPTQSMAVAAIIKIKPGKSKVRKSSFQVSLRLGLSLRKKNSMANAMPAVGRLMKKH